MYGRTTAAVVTAAAVFGLLGSLGLPVMAAQPNPKVNVDVYYESLCSDSVHFITETLAPAYQGLKDYIHLNLVPFGKASWSKKEGQLARFACQHGPPECHGNLAQACGLQEIAASFAGAAGQDKAMEFVDCVMDADNPSTAVPECAERKGLSAESVKRINKCVTTSQGEDLLIAHGVRTNNFEKPIQFIPSIAINGVKSPDAFRNFKSVVCAELYKAGAKPAACSEQ